MSPIAAASQSLSGGLLNSCHSDELAGLLESARKGLSRRLITPFIDLFSVSIQKAEAYVK